MKSRLDSEKQILLQEHDKDLDNYQRVVCEKNDLENRYDMLVRELTQLKGGKVNNLHNRNLSDTSFLSQMDDSIITLTNDGAEEVRHMLYSLSNCGKYKSSRLNILKFAG